MEKKRRRFLWLLWLPVLLILLLAGQGAATELRTQSREALRQTVLRAAAQCYAVEGVYPPDLGYLEEHYGLRVNRRRYEVVYEAFSSNLPPELQVLEKGREG